MPPKTCAEMEWERLKLEPGSYIDEQLASSHSDLLFSCRLRGKRVLLYLLVEHQTTVDPLMPFRAAAYRIAIWKDWLKKNAGSRGLPVIIPIVIHQGRHRWNGPVNLLELFELPGELQAELQPELLSGGFLLLDLSTVDVEKLRCGLLLRLGLGMMKAAVEGAQLDWIEHHAERLAELLQRAEGPALVETFLRYAFYTAREPERVRLFPAVSFSPMPLMNS